MPQDALLQYLIPIWQQWVSKGFDIFLIENQQLPVACCVTQQLELASESTHPGSSLSLRVQPVQLTGTPVTTTSRPTNDNSDAVNNNVMTHSATNPQTSALLRVQRSSSTTNQQKNSQLHFVIKPLLRLLQPDKHAVCTYYHHFLLTELLYSTFCWQF